MSAGTDPLESYASALAAEIMLAVARMAPLAEVVEA
jgi:hypothetical protein